MPQYPAKTNKMSNKEGNKRIIGIDPGTNRIGYGVIEKDGSKLIPLDYGVFEIKEKYGPDQLMLIASLLEEKIRQWQPARAGIETVFFSKNKKTGIAVAEARGAIVLTVRRAGLAVTEIQPNIVKQAVTGYASADKKAVQKMTLKILKITDFNSIDDAADALAIAIATSSLPDK